MSGLKPKTEVILLPNQWLTSQERQVALTMLFSPQERKTLQSYQQITQKLFAQAQAIIVDLVKPDGYLGDTIRDSRLTGVLNLHYPGKKIFELSRYPSLLGKHRFVTQLKTARGKINLKYRETQDAPEQEETFATDQIVKVSSLFNGELPPVFFHQKPGNGITFKNLNLHHVYRQQIVWEIIYNISDLASLPPPSVKISQADITAAQQIYQALIKSQDSLNFVIHPDAHSNHFEEKKWPVEKWIGLIRQLIQQYQPNIFLSTGADHPQVSQEIYQRCTQEQLPVTLIPSLPLAQYAGFLMNFPKKTLVFVGLESMAGSHLAPGLGIKSTVIGASKLFEPSVFGPFGGIVVQNNQSTAASIPVEAVVQAIEIIKEI
ncbi:MAG: glycosyltransferase family 9 protein [Patescibacteria group bacterium]|jgi:ADP-heptose:LPS heptosyltransferase